MPLTLEHLKKLKDYYRVSDSAYRNWGQNANHDDLYAIHLGYSDELQTPITPSSNKKNTQRMTAKIIEELAPSTNQRIVDAGCGVGSIALNLGLLFPTIKVYGLNVVDNQLTQACNTSQALGTTNVHFLLQDYQRTAFRDNTIDTIVFCESLAHAQNKAELTSEAFRILKPGGKLLIADVFTRDVQFTLEEQQHFTNFQLGMGVPNIIRLDEFIGYLKFTGYTNIHPHNITAHVLPSAIFASKHAKQQYELQQETATELMQHGRLAMIGVEKLMSAKKADYYFLKANKPF